MLPHICCYNVAHGATAVFLLGLLSFEGPPCCSTAVVLALLHGPLVFSCFAEELRLGIG